MAQCDAILVERFEAPHVVEYQLLLKTLDCLHQQQPTNQINYLAFIELYSLCITIINNYSVK